MAVDQCFQVALAFLIAMFITWVELITTRYPRTVTFVFRCPALWGYAALYGLMAGLADLGIGALTKAGQVQTSGIFSSSPWLLAVGLGLSTKALLHINLFSVTVSGTKSFPLGTETIVLLFEPWLLTEIQFHEYNETFEFLQPYVSKYTNLDDAKQRAIAHIPGTFPKDQAAALKVDFNLCGDVGKVLDLYLRTFGVRAFRNAFPL